MTSTVGHSEHYARAPIVEAAIELRFADEMPLELIDQASERVQKFYPKKNSEISAGFSFKVEENRLHTEQPNHETVGYRLMSEDELERLVLKKSTFICAQLAPYTDWETFVGRAKRDWAVVRKVRKSGALRRLGVRFINRIDIPNLDLQPIEIADYLNVQPGIPIPGSNVLESFTIQVVTPLPNDHMRVKLTVATTDAPVPDTNAILLDVDVSTEVDIPAVEGKLWAFVDTFRQMKNSIFESAITEKTRKLFR